MRIPCATATNAEKLPPVSRCSATSADALTISSSARIVIRIHAMQKFVTNAARAISRRLILASRPGCLRCWHSCRPCPEFCSFSLRSCSPSACSTPCSQISRSYSNSCLLDSCWPSSGICTCTSLTLSGELYPDCSDAPRRTTMTIRLPNSKIERSSASAPKARWPGAAKPAHLRPFSAITGGQHCPPHCPLPGRPFPGQQMPFLESVGARLGPPLTISEAARLIGCSPWTVRQTLIPRGLPHFRFKASGRLVFYRDQIIRWIENQQQGGKQQA